MIIKYIVFPLTLWTLKTFQAGHKSTSGRIQGSAKPEKISMLLSLSRWKIYAIKDYNLQLPWKPNFSGRKG